MTDVLLIEDDRALLASLARVLELADLAVTPTASYIEAKDHILADFPGVILSDIRMPGRDGFAVLARAKEIDADLPVVFLTGEGDVPTAVRAMSEGAWDFLEKPANPDRLLEVLLRALDHRRLVLRSRELEERLNRADAAAINFPGASQASQGLRSALRAAAAGPGHVHLFGPEGAGKRLAANTIFTLSAGADRFATLSLAEATASDLRHRNFGSEEAVVLHLKHIDLADEDHGDALAECLETHPKLRLITSSLSPLADDGAVASVGLGQIEVELPSLARRQRDIPAIFEMLVRQTVRTLNGDMPHLPDDVLTGLAARPWPGNLPELRKAAHSYALSGRSAPMDVQVMPLTEQMDGFEAAVLRDTLIRFRGRSGQAAEALGLPRKTFYDRLAKHGIKPADFKPKAG